MPIKSYLAHPFEGKKTELIAELSALSFCEVIPADNKELLILVTDTDNNEDEELLKQQLETVGHLKLLTLVSGFNANKND